MKTKKTKELDVDELTRRLGASPVSLFASFQGLSTPELFDARKKMKNEKAQLKVVKKSLLKKAFDKAGIQAGSPDFWKGDIAALTSSNGDPLRPIKLLADWAGQNQKVAIKGGYLLDKKVWLDRKSVEAMSKLPGVKELQAQLVGALAGPLSGLGGVLTAVMTQFLLVLKAIEGSAQKSGAAPAKT